MCHYNLSEVDKSWPRGPFVALRDLVLFLGMPPVSNESPDPSEMVGAGLRALFKLPHFLWTTYIFLIWKKYWLLGLLSPVGSYSLPPKSLKRHSEAWEDHAELSKISEHPPEVTKPQLWLPLKGPFRALLIDLGPPIVKSARYQFTVTADYCVTISVLPTGKTVAENWLKTINTSQLDRIELSDS